MTQEFFIENTNQYKDTIFRIALNYIGNSYDADDIVQEVLLKFYETNKHFDSNEHLRNWLIRVTLNQCKNLLCRPWMKKNVSLEEWSGSVEGDDANMFLAENVYDFLENFNNNRYAESINLGESATMTLAFVQTRDTQEPLFLQGYDRLIHFEIN